MRADDLPPDDQLPTSRRPPWWHGKLAHRDLLLIGFIIICTFVAMVFFLLIVLGRAAD